MAICASVTAIGVCGRKLDYANQRGTGWTLIGWSEGCERSLKGFRGHIGLAQITCPSSLRMTYSYKFQQYLGTVSYEKDTEWSEPLRLLNPDKPGNPEKTHSVSCVNN
ncbi:hypothetical protein EYF80_022421 [Liparis tanakae]|uniref:Uncharacterized protein n=1 Tax=Liparis tanakae TaxID=230148 RepID=A0A4Z2HQQ7_9TELE|nr:hypothetical protein EYF80_022421 [Liparis tanakae]